MLPDPIEITVDVTPHELPRNWSARNGSFYGSLSGEWVITINHSLTPEGMRRSEVLLRYNHPDPTPEPFSGGPASIPNSFGVVVETNNLLAFSEDDLPVLRQALLDFIDDGDTFSRIFIGGEI
jgi:hypothetical protein